MVLKKLITDLVITTGLAILILATTELLLRLAPVDIVHAFRAGEEPAYETHPQYLVGLKPNLNRSHRRWEQGREVQTRWSTNGQSFRGPEARLKKSETRVIVYGDSNIFAQFSNLEDTFPYQLQEQLIRRTHSDIEVINAGVPGFGPDQSLLRFEQDVDALKPDIVVLHVFADNDFGDLVRNRLFTLDRSDHLVRELPALDPDPCLTQAGDCEAGIPLGGVRGMARSLMVVKVGQAIVGWSTLLPSLGEPATEEVVRYYLRLGEFENAVLREGQPRKVSHFLDHYDFDLALFPNADSSKSKVKLMEAVLKEANALARRKHVSLLVLIQPSSVDLTTNMHPNYEDLGQFPEYRRDRLTQLVERVARSQGIDVINLFDLFMGRDPNKLYRLDNDDHWNEAGQALAADAVAEFIGDRYLSIPGNAPLVLNGIEFRS